MQVIADDIHRVIDNLQEEVRKADPKIKKQIVQQLFDRILVFPKEGKDGERRLEIRGSSLPLARVNMAPPTGFEPVLPA